MPKREFNDKTPKKPSMIREGFKVDKNKKCGNFQTRVFFIFFSTLNPSFTHFYLINKWV